MDKRILLSLAFLLLPFMSVSANSDAGIEDVHFEDGYMVFHTDDCTKSTLSYISADGKIKVNLSDNSYSQTHRIQLWNLDFTSFNYVLTVTDAFKDSSSVNGSFTVSPLN